MIIAKARRVGSYVKFQLLPKWTVDGELVCCEFVRATFNGNDNGYVTIERLKSQREWETGIA